MQQLDGKLTRYEKIAFLGEGQVNINTFKMCTKEV